MCESKDAMYCRGPCELFLTLTTISKTETHEFLAFWKHQLEYFLPSIHHINLTIHFNKTKHQCHGHWWVKWRWYAAATAQSSSNQVPARDGATTDMQ